MFTHVEVVSQQGLKLVLPLQNVVDGYVIQDIDGLDPVKANIVSSSFAQIDGAQYQSSSREERNIVLKLGLEAALYTKGTVRDLRNRLYSYLMPKSYVLLRFIDSEGPTVEINGYVETFDSKLFVKEPEATISILCMNPDFVDPNVVTINGTTVSTATDIEIDYEGSVDTGVNFTLNVNRAITGFSINHQPGSGAIRTMDFSYALSAGDVVKVSTTPGAKGVTLIRGTTETSILHAMSGYSSWLSLEPGKNYLRVTVAGAAIPYTIEYTDKYGGL